jgi:hypothetical protein
LHWSELECSDLDIPIGISEQEDSKDEVQILEPPSIPLADLVREDETEPPQTLPKRGVEAILSSEESDQDIKMLVERGRVVKAW